MNFHVLGMVLMIIASTSALLGGLLIHGLAAAAMAGFHGYCIGSIIEAKRTGDAGR